LTHRGPRTGRNCRLAEGPDGAHFQAPPLRADVMVIQDQSLSESVRDWVVARGYTDLGLQAVVLALFLLLVLGAVAGSLYWLWWIVRLSNSQNVQDFTAKPIPGLRKGKVAGQEFEFGEVAKAETEALRLMRHTIEELSFRLGTTETALKKLEGAFEHFEDVSGRA
jgi:hypothetical protein